MSEAIKLDDCWRKIGVWSRTPTCPTLPEVVHCRNCPVYSAAGRTLLERPLQEDLGKVTERYAQPLPSQTRAKGKVFMVFRIGREWLALPARCIKVITHPVAVRQIPHRNNPLLRGLANIAGALELVVSLETLLGLEALSGAAAEAVEQEAAQRKRRAIPRMLLLGSQSGGFAFAVDEVLGSYRHVAESMQPVPSTLERARLRYVSDTIELEADARSIMLQGQQGDIRKRLRVGVLDVGLITYSVEQVLT